MLQEPFAVINADDYYGKEAFVRLHSFLEQYSPREPRRFCMAGFVLRNTLSENGGVTRGICRMDASGYLTGVHETRNILRIRRDGEILAEAEGQSIDPDSLVSMNMWGLTPEFLSILEEGFAFFFEELDPESPEALKAEYLLPNCIDRLLQAGEAQVQVLKTHDRWFGVTYQEDRATVMESFRELIRQGVYQEDLFSDLKR